MKKTIISCICILSLLSCEKIWVEDLCEKAYDTIRGYYDIESIVWEEDEPIDIDGDGEASFDYLAEWSRILYGSEGDNIITNSRGSLSIPYIIDSRANYGPGHEPSLSNSFIGYHFLLNAVVEGNDSHLEFKLPADGSEFSHSGYGEITLRTEVTLTTLTEAGTTKDVTGTILIKYIRTQYRTGN